MRNLLTFLLFLAFNTFASTDCQTVVKGYEAKDTMYVLCDDLSSYSKEELSGKLNSIFEQYAGLPDEILVYFIASKDAIGKYEQDIKAGDLAGVYYTHGSILTIWPKVNHLKKEIALRE